MADVSLFDETCITREYSDPCQNICDVLNTDTLKKKCCVLSRCQNCIKSIPKGRCGESGDALINASMEMIDSVLNMTKCPQSDRYPSLICIYQFYSLWFFVIPSVIVALIIATIVVVVIAKRKNAPKVSSSHVSCDKGHQNPSFQSQTLNVGQPINPHMLHSHQPLNSFVQGTSIYPVLNNTAPNN
jgi:hypothetical protein